MAYAQSVYVCPMDPDVRSNAAGVCSRCGMKLRSTIPDPAEYPVELRVTPRAPRPGMAAQLELVVRSPWNGHPVTDFQVTHEKLFHLFVVGPDLEFFAHEHPALGASGAFRVDVEFPSAGVYRLLADFYPDGGTPQLAAKTVIIPGVAPPPPVLMPDSAVKDAANLQVGLATTPAHAIARTKTSLVFRLNPADGLETYLGAWGHMLAASDDGIDLIHEHPFDRSGEAEIQFDVIFPRQRTYRVWVQFQRNGVVNTARFDVPVYAF
jgi:Heavy metal binding domain